MNLLGHVQHYLAEGIEEKYALLKKKFPSESEARLKVLAEKIDQGLMKVNLQQIKDEDIEDLLDDAKFVKSKRSGKIHGMSGLVEGEDYLVVKENQNTFIPLNHHASKIIASDVVGTCTGKWCTSKNSPTSWNEYADGKTMLIYIVGNYTKTAIAWNPKGIFAFDDANLPIKPSRLDLEIPYEKYYSVFLKKMEK